MKTKAIIFALSLVLLVSLSVIADVPDQITYQGRLLYNGSPVTSATNIDFYLYENQGDAVGTHVFSDTSQTVTPDSNGIYTVILGPTIPDDYDSLWLELVVEGNTLTPRKKLTSSPFVLRAGELPELYVSGNVGIGTTSPDTALHVVGNTGIKLEGDTNPRFTIADDSATKGYLGLVTAADAWAPGTTDGDIIFRAENNDIFFSADAGINTHMVIESSGNVGIGTTSPADMLELNSLGTVRLRLTSSPGYYSYLENNASESNPFNLRVMWGNVLEVRDAGSKVFINAPTQAYPERGIGFQYAGETKMWVDMSGNVGIGTTSPDGALHISTPSGEYKFKQGYVEFLQNIGTYGNPTLKLVDNDNQVDRAILHTQGNGGAIEALWVATNGKVGIGTTSPSTKLHVAGTITEDSDGRLKENIHSIDSALDKIAMLRGVAFEWKDKEGQDERTHLGVIGQEVEGVFPEVVFTSADEQGTKSVNYNGLVAPLIEAVKELRAQNDALKALVCQEHPKAVLCD